MSQPIPEGQIIGSRYAIDSLLGQGGMATVYLGRDTATGEPVAVKLLKPEIVAQDPGLVQRFAREGEALRRLNHPNIVKMLATVIEDGRHYVVMEYVGGGDLRARIDDHRQRGDSIPIEQVMDTALDLCDALTRAHRLKIIHRDIKPANVLIAQDGTPRLTDFGVAHFDDAPGMTQTGAMIGTLAYLSPEACMGQQIDARADLWAFGVMLYEMLALRLPFEESSTGALLTAILTKTPEDLVELRPDAPPALVGLVERMLIKDRDQRIGSARLVGAQLEAIIGGREVPVSLDTDQTPAPLSQMGDMGDSAARAPVRTPVPGQNSLEGATIAAPAASSPPARSPSRGLIAGLAAVLVIGLAAAGLIASGVLGGEAETAAPSAQTAAGQIVQVEPVAEDEFMVLVSQFETISGATREDPSRFVFDDLQTRFERDLGSLSNVRVRRYPAVITSAEQALAAAEANGADVVIWGRYDDSGSQVNVQAGVLETDLFPRATVTALTDIRLDLDDEVRQSLAMPVLGIQSALGVAANRFYESAINFGARAELSADTSSFIAIPGNSTAARWHRIVQGYYQDAEGALAELDAAIGLDARNPFLFVARAIVLQRLGRLDEADDNTRTAQRLGPEGWGSPPLMFMFSALLGEDFQATLPYADELAALAPDDWYILSLKGGFEYLAGEYEAAQVSLDRARELGPQANFPYIFLTALALRGGRLQDAQALISEVLERFPDPTFTERIMNAVFGITEENNALGAMQTAFGNFTLRQWNAVIRQTQQVLELSPTYADAYPLQGLAYCNLGSYAEAEASYTQLLEADPTFWIVYLLRAEVRIAQGRLTEALADLNAILTSDQADIYRPLLPAFQSGEITCRNFLDVDLSALTGQ